MREKAGPDSDSEAETLSRDPWRAERIAYEVEPIVRRERNAAAYYWKLAAHGYHAELLRRDSMLRVAVTVATFASVVAIALAARWI